jgi:hypothetical protein
MNFFLSYKYGDVRHETPARALKDLLEALGHQVTQHRGLRNVGDKFVPEVEQLIRECDCLFAFIDGEQPGDYSHWIERERLFGAMHGVEIFPVRISGRPDPYVLEIFVDGTKVDLDTISAAIRRIGDLETKSLKHSKDRLQRMMRGVLEHLPSSARFEILDTLQTIIFGDNAKEGHGIRREEEWLRKELRSALAFRAVDALGPEPWLNPHHYRYFALQVREYLRRNYERASSSGPDSSKSSGSGRMVVTVRPPLNEAINRSAENARTRYRFPESNTRWDNPGDLTINVSEGGGFFEYSRILLWDEAQLGSEIAGSIIALHEVFNVPLLCRVTRRDDIARSASYFFLETPPRVLENPARDHGLIGRYFLTADGSAKEGDVLRSGRIPVPTLQDKHVDELYSDHLAADDIAFARDVHDSVVQARR